MDLNNRERLYWGTMFVSSGTELGTVEVSGTFKRYDGSELPESLALFLYVENEDAPDDFVRGQGIIDPSTGNFTATITDIAPKYSRGLLSFVSLDIADAPGGRNGNGVTATSVFEMNIVNEGCSDALRITLQWDGEADLDLWVTEPGGQKVSKRAETIGVSTGCSQSRYLGTDEGMAYIHILVDDSFARMCCKIFTLRLSSNFSPLLSSSGISIHPATEYTSRTYRTGVNIRYQA